jgi:4'-phosphopantetheinyl transferase
MNNVLTIDQFQDTAPNIAPVTTWHAPPRLLLLSEQGVDVWRASLDVRPSRVQELKQILSPDEIARAQRFRFQKDHDHFIVARGLLRVILARYVDVAPAQLRFSYSSYGKPALTNALGQDILNFNMTHSQGLALYAITRGRKIGVDLEAIRYDFACEQIAARFFAPREYAALRSLSPGLKHEAFFNGWTRKEAYIKARGEGLSFPLDQFEVSLIPGEPAKLLNVERDVSEVARWSLRELDLGPSYAAALVVEGHDWCLKCWRWLE